MKRHWYAAQHPRGFANEIIVRVYAAKAERDRWVAVHRHDGGQNSAACGAFAADAREARALIARGAKRIQGEDQ